MPRKYLNIKKLVSCSAFIRKKLDFSSNMEQIKFLGKSLNIFNFYQDIIIFELFFFYSDYQTEEWRKGQAWSWPC